MHERMTWDEIVRLYPDQWVGLTDVERNGADIVTAVLTYTDRSSSELAMMQSTDENLVSMYTTPDNLAPLGAVGYFA